MTVTDADTAIAWRSGSVPVLATPRVIALCEEASVAALAGALREGETSVGMRVQIDHVQPTAIGADVSANEPPRRSATSSVERMIDSSSSAAPSPAVTGATFR